MSEGDRKGRPYNNRFKYVGRPLRSPLKSNETIQISKT